MAADQSSDLKRLGEWLVGMGVLQEGQVIELLELQHRDARAGVRTRLGELAVRCGWATPAEVTAALRRQADAVLAHVGIGDVLLSLGHVTPRQLRAVLEDRSRPLHSLETTLVERGACTPGQLSVARHLLALRHAGAVRQPAHSQFAPLNVMELLAMEALDPALQEDGGCTCAECWSQALAVALNALPPHYAAGTARLPEAVQSVRRDYDDLVRQAVREAVAAIRSDPKAPCRSRFSDDLLREGGFDGQVHPVVVHISNRHVHLSAEHVTALFGEGYTLRKWRDLMQPGQYAAEETVTLVGPKGELPHVRVLGPPRRQTQVEISGTDQFALGIRAPVRESGQLDGTPGIRLRGPAGEAVLENGVIRALRHIHLRPEDAERIGVRNGDRVAVRLVGDRTTICEGVLIRATSTSALEMHVDTDEANAAGLPQESTGEILLPPPAA